MANEPKKLFKGTFNYSGQIIVIYRRAYTNEKAIKLMINQLSKLIQMTPSFTRMYFNDQKNNHRIEEVK